MREQIQNRRLGLKKVARMMSTSIDLMCRYLYVGSQKNRVKYMPKSTKLALERYFKGLNMAA